MKQIDPAHSFRVIASPAYNFGVRGSNLTKLLQVTYRKAGMIKWGHFFWGTAPLRIWEGKNRPNFGAILRNFTF